jgi:hypothetical protein
MCEVFHPELFSGKIIGRKITSNDPGTVEGALGYKRKKRESVGTSALVIWMFANKNPRSVRSIVGQVNGLGWGCAQAEAPPDFVALGSGTKFAYFAVGRCFECAAAAHFLKDSFGIELGFEALEGAVNWLSFF